MADKINLDTGTDLPETFFLTEEFKNLFHKIENDNSNLFITEKQVVESQRYLNILGKILKKIMLF
jgi:hypothetical protein